MTWNLRCPELAALNQQGRTCSPPGLIILFLKIFFFFFVLGGNPFGPFSVVACCRSNNVRGSSDNGIVLSCWPKLLAAQLVASIANGCPGLNRCEGAGIPSVLMLLNFCNISTANTQARFCLVDAYNYCFSASDIPRQQCASLDNVVVRDVRIF